MAKEKYKIIPAAHLFLIKDKKILLARRFQTGWMDGYYSVPAGHFDGNETARHVMAREAQEEIGITITESDLQFAHVMHRHTHEGEQNERVDFFFTANKWQGEPKITEPDKCDDIKWVSLSQLPNNMVPYVASAIEHYKKGSVYSEFDWS